MAVPNPYSISEYRGRPLDNATIAAVMMAEHKLGYPLTIIQGIGGAEASGGTHLKGRAVDTAYWDHVRKMRVFRDIGFAHWPREMLPGVWPEHGHGVLIFENRVNRRNLTESAFAQIGKFDRGENGLVGDTQDTYPYRPNPKAVFTGAEYEFVMKGGLEIPTETKVTKARDAIVGALHELSAAIAFLGDTPENRVKAQKALEEIKRERRELRKILREMPQR
jgi:hypothetical protein